MKLTNEEKHKQKKANIKDFQVSLYFGFGLTTLPERVITGCLAPWNVEVLGTELGCSWGVGNLWE